MPQYSENYVRALHKTVTERNPQFKGVPLEDFIAYANKATGSDAYSIQGGLKGLLSQPGSFVNKAMEMSGAPDLGERAGGGFARMLGFGQHGQELLGQATRGMVSGIPELAMLAGSGGIASAAKAGIAGASALAGSRALAETGDYGQAGVSAATMALMPKFADMGASGLTNWLGRTSPAMGARLAGDTMATRVANIAGSNLGMVAPNVASDLASRKLAQEEGQDIFGNTADTPEDQRFGIGDWLTTMAVNQVPGLVLDLPRLGAGGKGLRVFKPNETATSTPGGAADVAYIALERAQKEAELRAKAYAEATAAKQKSKAFTLWTEPSAKLHNAPTSVEFQKSKAFTIWNPATGVKVKKPSDVAPAIDDKKYVFGIGPADATPAVEIVSSVKPTITPSETPAPIVTSAEKSSDGNAGEVSKTVSTDAGIVQGGGGEGAAPVGEEVAATPDRLAAVRAQAEALRKKNQERAAALSKLPPDQAAADIAAMDHEGVVSVRTDAKRAQQVDHAVERGADPAQGAKGTINADIVDVNIQVTHAKNKPMNPVGEVFAEKLQAASERARAAVEASLLAPEVKQQEVAKITEIERIMHAATARATDAKFDEATAQQNLNLVQDAFDQWNKGYLGKTKQHAPRENVKVLAALVKTKLDGVAKKAKVEAEKTTTRKEKTKQTREEQTSERYVLMQEKAAEGNSVAKFVLDYVNKKASGREDATSLYEAAMDYGHQFWQSPLDKEAAALAIEKRTEKLRTPSKYVEGGARMGHRQDGSWGEATRTNPLKKYTPEEAVRFRNAHLNDDFTYTTKPTADKKGVYIYQEPRGGAFIGLDSQAELADGNTLARQDADALGEDFDYPPIERVEGEDIDSDALARDMEADWVPEGERDDLLITSSAKLNEQESRDLTEAKRLGQESGIVRGTVKNEKAWSRDGRMTEGNFELAKRTGWHMGVYGEWVKWVSDKDSSINAKALMQLRGGKKLMLPQVMQHPELYRLYPALKNVTVSLENLSDASAAYSAERKHISIGVKFFQNAPKTKEAMMKKVLAMDAIHEMFLHETQHAVMDEGNGPMGANKEMMQHRVPLMYSLKNVAFIRLSELRDGVVKDKRGLSEKQVVLYEEIKNLSEEQLKNVQQLASDFVGKSAFDNYQRAVGEVYADLTESQKGKSQTELEQMLGDHKGYPLDELLIFHSDPTSFVRIELVKRYRLDPKSAPVMEYTVLPTPKHVALAKSLVKEGKIASESLVKLANGEKVVFGDDMVAQALKNAGVKVGENRLSAKEEGVSKEEVAQSLQEVAARNAREQELTTENTYSRIMSEFGYEPKFAKDFGRIAKQLGDVFGQFAPLRLKELVGWAKGENTTAGVTLSMTGGAKVIAVRALSAEEGGVAMMHTTLAHEVGHVAIKLAAEGKLPKDLSAPIDYFLKSFSGTTMESRKATLEEVYQIMMPEHLKSDQVLAQLTSESSLNSPAEYLSNITALSMLSATKEGPRTFGQKIAAIPVQLMSVVRSALRMVVDVYHSWTNAKMWETRSKYGRLGQQIDVAQAARFGKAVKAQIREIKKADVALKQFSEVGNIYSGSWVGLMDKGTDQVHISTLDRFGKATLEFMTLQGEDPDGVKRRAVDSILPIMNLASGDERIREVFYTVQNEPKYQHSFVNESNAILFAVDPNDKSVPLRLDRENGPVARVMRDQGMREMLSEIKRMEAEKHTSVFDLIQAKDKDMEKVLSRFTTESRKKDVLETLARMQLIQKKQVEEFHHVQQASFNHLAGSILLKKGVVNGALNAKAMSERVYEQTKMNLATGDVGPTTALFMSMGLPDNQALSLAQLYMKNVKSIEGMHAKAAASPEYVTERRMHQYQVGYYDKAQKRRGMVSFKEKEAAQEYIKKIRANKKIQLIHEQPLDAWATRKQRVQDDGLFDLLSNAESKAKVSLAEDLVRDHSFTPEEAADMSNHMDFLQTLREHQLAQTLGTINISRKFAPGRETLDMFEQQAMNTQALSKTLARRYTDSYFKLLKLDPEIYNDSTLPLNEKLEQAVQNFRVPDTKVGQAISTINYMYFVSTNLSNMVLEQTSWLTQLAPMLTEEGVSTLDGYKHIAHAASEAASSKKSPEIVRLLHTAELEGRRGLGYLHELSDPIVGEVERGTWRTNPIAHLTRLVNMPYQSAVRFNESVALITAFNVTKAKHYSPNAKLTDGQFKHVYEEALRIAGTTNASFGKINRPSFIGNARGEAWRTTAQAIYSLQGFVSNSYASMIRQYRAGFAKEYKHLPIEQRAAAKKALAQAVTTFIGLAGMAGVPGLLVADKLQEKFTDIDISTAFTEMLRANTGEFGDFFGDVASHGLLHAVGLPVDISQRVAPAGIFGFNSYDGFQVQKLAGPITGVGTNLFNSLSAASHGDWSKALTAALPPAGQNLVKAITQNQITNTSGDAVPGTDSWGSKLAHVLGFKPRASVEAMDATMVAKHANATQTRQNKAHSDTLVAALERGDMVQARSLLGEVQKKYGGLVEPRTILESALDELEGKTFGRDPRGMVRLGASARVSGMKMPGVGPGKFDRTLWKERLKSQVLGEQVDVRRLQKAKVMDGLMGKDARLSEAEAGYKADQLFQMMRGG